MDRYIVETGNNRYEQLADDAEEAVVKAFKRRAPKDPAVLTRIKLQGRRVGWMYISTLAMMRKAGYEVNYDFGEKK
jgi:hypothetical protein